MRAYKNLFFLLLIFAPLNTNGQITYEEIVKRYKSKDFNQKKADSILSLLPYKDSLYAQTSHDISFFFYKKKKEYDLAIKYGKIEISVLEKLKLNNKTYANGLYNLGKFHFKKGDYDNSIKYYQKAIKSNTSSLKTAQSYCGIGRCYRIKGDYYKSLDYYQKGIPLIKKHSTLGSLVSRYINYSLSCKKMNTKKSALLGINASKKADSILHENPELVNDNRFYPLYANLANLYSQKHFFNYKKAKHYYLKNLKRGLRKQNNLYIANSYSNLGELYFKQKNDSCLFFFKKSIEYSIEDKNSTAESYRNLANYYKLKANYNKALKKINNSLKFSLYNNNNSYTLSKNELLNTTGKRNISRALETKIEILIALFNNTKNKKYLNEAISTVNLANKLINVVLEFSTERNTKYLWREVISSIYSLGVEAGFLLNNPSLMFNYIEKNKAFLLNQNINNYLNKNSLPYEITSNDLLFKKKILKLEQNTLTKKLRDSLFHLKEQYQIFEDSIAKIHPAYLKSKKNILITTLDEAKNKLQKNDLIISYCLGKSNLFGVLISKKHVIHFKTNKTDEFLNLIKSYRKLISKPLKSQEELKKFKTISFNLYNKLFPTKKIKDLIKGKNITLVPDITFENIPFEALNTNKNSLNYLIEKTNISYAYSVSFLNSNKKINRQSTNVFSCYAPIKFNNNLTPLPFTKNEVNYANSLFKGASFTYNSASKKKFLEESLNSKIVHLATHANYSKSPTIYFSRDSLKLHELYTYKSNADLVVLSACQTNLGEIKKGEGVLSLARGFFHSGANSVVSSLWNVNDNTSSFIMKYFYKNLESQESKLLALNNAKRKYLKEHSLSENSPYYWASFVLIGDTSPTFKSNFTTYYFLAFGCLLLIILLFFKKRG